MNGEAASQNNGGSAAKYRSLAFSDKWHQDFTRDVCMYNFESGLNFCGGNICGNVLWRERISADEGVKKPAKNSKSQNPKTDFVPLASSQTTDFLSIIVLCLVSSNNRKQVYLHSALACFAWISLTLPSVTPQLACLGLQFIINDGNDNMIQLKRLRCTPWFAVYIS